MFPVSASKGSEEDRRCVLGSLFYIFFSEMWSVPALCAGSFTPLSGGLGRVAGMATLAADNQSLLTVNLGS